MEKVYYAGIGSRKTPSDILDKMKVIGYVLAIQGYILRSGGAEGADSAFENGCDLAKGNKEIFLPWKGFNGNQSFLYTPSPESFELASKHHPTWRSLSDGAKSLHARNGHQMLGKDLKTPVSFVVCYSEGTGGTEQALRIATSLGIRVYNLHNMLTPALGGLTLLEVFWSIYKNVECRS